MSLSVVIPIYNERDNVDLLYAGLTEALDAYGRTYELIFVNDGSRDGSTEKLETLAARDGRVKIVEFRRNFGQTAAMQAGIQHATLDYVVTMDGDLQNDPTDIPRMVAKLEEGFDLIHGWRKHRQDAFVNRKLPSKMANWLIAKVTGFPVHDLGCTLKVMRREIAQELQLSWARCTASSRSWHTGKEPAAPRSKPNIIRVVSARPSTASAGRPACCSTY